MKRLANTLGALSLIGTPLTAQTTIIGGATSNGDFEAGVINPFGPHGGLLGDAVTNVDDRNHTDGGQYSLKVDLTANNGNGQWKGVTTLDDGANGVMGEYLPDHSVTSRVWVYIPAATTFGATANFVFQLETRNANSPTDPDTFAPPGGTWQSFNLKNLPRDTWLVLERKNDAVPVGTTHIRTRAWNITTVAEVPDPENPGSTLPTSGPAPTPEAPNGNAYPMAWEGAGYSGVIFIDDIQLELIPPNPLTIAIDGDNANGDFENPTLTPWNTPGGTAEPDPAAAEDRPFGGTQALAIDLTANNGNGQWKGLTQVSAPAPAGSLIEYSTWVYMPSDTKGGDPDKVAPNLKLALPLRSDNGGGGNGNVGGWPAIDLNNEETLPRDTWVQFRYGPIVAINGPDDQAITSISTNGMNLETLNALPDPDDPATMLDTFGAAGPTVAEPSDWVANGYEGKVYIDNFKLTVTSSPKPEDGVLTVLADQINNGSIEAATQDPWGGSGVSVSTAQNHTPGGSKSLEIDLTANNSGGTVDLAAKRFLDRALLSSVASTADTDTIDLSAWVYVPASASFGAGDGVLSLEISDHTLTPFHFLELDLADDGDAPRDQWVLLEDTGIPIPEGTEAESLIFTSFQVYTTDLIIVNEGTPEEEELDADDPRLTPADWIANGYTGSIFIDDISVSVTRAPITSIEVISTAYGPGGFGITYAPAEAAVDVYHTADLETFTPFQLNVTGGTITDGDAADVPKGFYYILPAGSDAPGNGN